ncbi:KIF4B [Acrasis kona]
MPRALKYIEAYISEEMQMGTYQQRLEIAQQHMGADFGDVTGIIDGVHIWVKHLRPTSKYGFEHDSWYSYKFQKFGINIQVMCDGMRAPIWTDLGNPAGVHDIRCVTRSKLEDKLHPNEKILADGGYVNSRSRIRFVHGYRKPANNELPRYKQRFNERLSAERVRIEQLFGVTKLLFEAFRVGFRGDVEWVGTLFRLALVLAWKSIDRGIVTQNRLAEAVELINREEEQERIERELRNDPIQDDFDFDEVPEGYYPQRQGRVVNFRRPWEEEQQHFEMQHDAARYPHRAENRMQQHILRRDRFEDDFHRHARERAEQVRNWRQQEDIVLQQRYNRANPRPIGRFNLEDILQ